LILALGPQAKQACRARFALVPQFGSPDAVGLQICVLGKEVP
jgi:hypothetical protein